jgi:hypothetical protein
MADEDMIYGMRFKNAGYGRSKIPHSAFCASAFRAAEKVKE